jgi:tetratricopeptide (TPR) repeat protein
LAKRNLGLAYIEAGRTFQSVADMQQGYRLLLACEPDFASDAAVSTGMGFALLETGCAAEAAGMFERAVRLKPNVALHYIDESFALLQAHDRASTIENLEKALQIDPMLQAAYRKLAEIYLEDRDRVKLRETFERCLEAFPQSIEAQVALRTIGSGRRGY